jgi:hypothetical protein
MFLDEVASFERRCRAGSFLSTVRRERIEHVLYARFAIVGR